MNSCSKDDPINELVIPDTYNFENVSYDGQTQRINMLNELKSYMGSANEMGTSLDIDRLNAMFENGDGANWQGSYEASKQLKSKTFELYQSDFDGQLMKLAEASTSMTNGTDGVAGVVESLDGEKKYLLGADGLEYAQVIEKSLMGACFYYQATAVYMGSDKMDVDNELVEEGEGTEMEHHWDEGFGYFGVNKNFPSDLDGLSSWGKYANDRNALISCNEKLMDAFLKGRSAISAKQYDKRDEAITEARTEWELVIASTAIHYLNNGIANFNDPAHRAHALSESIGFAFSLKFNPDRKMTNEEIDAVLVQIAGDAAFDNMNLYNADTAMLQEAIDQLADRYDLNDIKDQL